MITDEYVEPVVGDHRTDRMDAWTAVFPHRGEIAQPDSILVDERLTRLGELGPLGGEFAPAHQRSRVSGHCPRRRAAAERAGSARSTVGSGPPPCAPCRPRRPGD